MRGIRSLRGHRVMLDRDLAVLCGVETRALVQAVRRNRGRFRPDFMFQLARQEFGNLRSQSVMSSWGGRQSIPLAFTEQGVSMLSGVLRSPWAVQVNIEAIRRLMAPAASPARRKIGFAPSRASKQTEPGPKGADRQYGHIRLH